MAKHIDEQFTLPKGLEHKYLTFLKDERYSEMCWLGGFATAKTDCLVTSIIRTGYEYPGSIMVLARDELVNLKRTTLVDLLNKGGNLIAHHNRTESVITFPAIPDFNGVKRQSQLFCFGMMTGDYVQKLKSLQPFRIFIDEGDKILEEMFDMAVLRVRQKAYHRETGKLGRNQVKIVANDEGNNWLFRRFVGKPHPGKAMTPEWVKENVGLREQLFTPSVAGADLFDGDLVLYRGNKHLVTALTTDGRAMLSGLGAPVEVPETQVVIQRLCIYAFTHENKSLNQQNLRNARGVSGALRDKYILGQIDTQTGLLFPEFSPGIHVVPQQDVPFSWRVIVGIDHGYDHPTAAVAMGLGPDGDVLIFNEYSQVGLSAAENGYGVAEMMAGYEQVRYVGDTQMWNVDPRDPGENIAKDYERAGVRPLSRANKNREVSINRIKEYLVPRASSVFDPEPKPRLYVMDGCAGVIRTMQHMTWEQYRAKKGDDILDALRYALMAVYNAGGRTDVTDVTPRPFVTWR
jgi:hypothetical protein